jgi:hypothetical protein
LDYWIKSFGGAENSLPKYLGLLVLVLTIIYLGYSIIESHRHLNEMQKNEGDLRKKVDEISMNLKNSMCSKYVNSN